MLTLVTGVVGLLGVASAFSALRHPNAALEALEAHTSTGPSAAVDDAKIAISRAVLKAPTRRAIQGSNLVVSALLWLAGTLLLVRKSDAVFWMGQAAVANAVWVVADVAASGFAIFAALPGLRAVASRAIIAGGSAQMAGIDGKWLVAASVFGLVLAGTLRIAFFVWVYKRVHRPDVAQWIAQPSQTE